MHVSAVVITRNEEKYIERCLSSLLWADEIVVVDAESSDRTMQICQNPQAPWSQQIRCFQRAWTGFQDQRNFSLSKTQYDWVFVLDADESCSLELSKKIKTLLSQPHEFCAYQVRRIEYLLSQPIHHGMWNPSYQDRLFCKKGVRYINDIHEYPLFPGPTGRIHEPIHHDPSLTPEKIFNKINTYTSIEAKVQYDQGKRTNAFHLIATFPAMSFKTYFYYGAYKDGIAGLVIALMEGLSRLMKHIKIWQLQRQASQT